MSDNRHSPQTGDAAVMAQAERWFARMRSDRLEPVDEFRFRNWLAEDPLHEREYRALEVFWDDLTAYGQADEVRAMSRAAFLETQPPETVPPRNVRAQRLRSVRRWSAAAAVVMVLVGALFVANPTIYTATYETGIGGRNSHQLLDGTRITLNTATALKVQYDLRSRRVWLENGQAHFEVTHSSFWPFEVDAGSGLVHALGTVFEVYRRNEEIQVTLVEGRLRVEKTPSVAAPTPQAGPAAQSHDAAENADRTSTPAGQGGAGLFSAVRDGQATILGPGQQVTVNPLGVSNIREASLPETTAWLHGRLVFDGERLVDAIAEVNRYSPVKLTIDNPELAEVRISGVFRAGGAETFVDALEASFPVQARARADGSLVLAANTDGPLPTHIDGLK